MSKTTKKKDGPQQRWRENIEALTVAVVVALLFKYFILEISKIPSGSMQPTLMGHPESGVFDRVLVDKLSFRFRDPQRFEIVVFKHPLERSRVMVKRLVGMPNEELSIRNGDLWTRGLPDGDWTILRPSGGVQDEMWRALDVDEPPRSSWRPSAGEDWHTLKDRGAQSEGPGRIAFRPDVPGIRDTYTDGYPDALRKRVSDSLRSSPASRFVGDVRVTGDVALAADATWFVAQLTEGERRYELRVPGPAADADAGVELHVDDGSGVPRVERAELEPLGSRETSFAFENLNDRLRVELRGEEVLAVDVPPSDDTRATVELGFEGGGGDLADLQVWRDIHYVGPERDGGWTVVIPDGQYVMLGDNTQDSADSRLWEQQTVELAGPGLPDRLRGNYRQQENPVRGAGRYADQVRFKDVWGEVLWFPRSAVGGSNGVRLDRSLSDLGPIEREPLVPRELIQGRAMAVFWPLKPTENLWRLGWLH